MFLNCCASAGTSGPRKDRVADEIIRPVLSAAPH